MNPGPDLDRIINMEAPGPEEIRDLARILRDLEYQVNANHRVALERSDPRLFEPHTR